MRTLLIASIILTSTTLSFLFQDGEGNSGGERLKQALDVILDCVGKLEETDLQTLLDHNQKVGYHSKDWISAENKTYFRTPPLDRFDDHTWIVVLTSAMNPGKDDL